MPLTTIGGYAVVGVPGQALNSWSGNTTTATTTNPTSITFTSTTTAVVVWISAAWVSGGATAATITINGQTFTLGSAAATSQVFANTTPVPFRGLVAGQTYIWPISFVGTNLLITSVVVESA